MSNELLLIKKSAPLSGTLSLVGAKNAVLTIIASLILTDGKSVLKNVPVSSDVYQMIKLLETLGAETDFNKEQKILTVDTSSINKFEVSPEIMNKMRASVLVMGPLLARFQKAKIALPGGCLIGARPIDFHLNGFRKMGAIIEQDGEFLGATLNSTNLETDRLIDRRVVFQYPSVGATENIMMCASLIPGITTIINAAYEPEVIDLAEALKKMGAKIEYGAGLTMRITGVERLNPIEHSIVPDRLEGGSLLLAAAITGGKIHITNGRPDHMDLFLEKLEEMGHHIDRSDGIFLRATQNPKAISFKTNPYPGFPTDLQAPMMAALTLADGTSEVEETVFENRFMHVKELQKMGAQITVDGRKAIIRGVEELYGSEVIASDIRASCALAIAGLSAQGETKMTGLHHWKRGYDALEEKLKSLGGNIRLV